MISLYHSIYKKEDVYLLQIAIDEAIEYLEDLADRFDGEKIHKSIAYKELTKFSDYLQDLIETK